jgi:hypothetical protein
MEYGLQIGQMLLLLPDFGENKLRREAINEWNLLLQSYYMIADKISFVRWQREKALENITLHYCNLKPFAEIRLRQGRPEELVAMATAETKELQKRLHVDAEAAAKLESRRYLLVFGVLCMVFAGGLIAWQLWQRGPLDIGLVLASISFAIVGTIMMFASGYPEKVDAFISATLPWFGKGSKSQQKSTS